jgi:hypothetical protein
MKPTMMTQHWENSKTQYDDRERFQTEELGIATVPRKEILCYF